MLRAEVKARVGGRHRKVAEAAPEATDNLSAASEAGGKAESAANPDSRQAPVPKKHATTKADTRDKIGKAVGMDGATYDVTSPASRST